MRFEDSVDIAMGVILAFFVLMIARGLVRWRSDGEEEVSGGLMGGVVPLSYLLRGVVSDGLLVVMLSVAFALLIVWRVRLSRRRRHDGRAAGA